MAIMNFLEKLFPLKSTKTSVEVDTIFDSMKDELKCKEMAFYIATSYIANTISKCEFKVYENKKEVKNETKQHKSKNNKIRRSRSARSPKRRQINPFEPNFGSKSGDCDPSKTNDKKKFKRNLHGRKFSNHLARHPRGAQTLKRAWKISFKSIQRSD